MPNYRIYQLLPILSVTCLILSFSCTGPQLSRPGLVLAPARELTRSEIMSLSAHNKLKAVINLDVEVAGKLVLDGASAVLYMEMPDKARLRVYQFGIPIFDVVHKGGEVRSKPPEEIETYRESFPLLLQAVFWWTSMNEASLEIFGNEYLLQTSQQAVWLERRSLLPIRQEVYSKNGVTKIRYSNPITFGQQKAFPSRIEIDSSNYSLVVTIKKLATDLFFNPDMFEWP